MVLYCKILNKGLLFLLSIVTRQYFYFTLLQHNVNIMYFNTIEMIQSRKSIIMMTMSSIVVKICAKTAK